MFDDIIKNKANEHEAPVPPDAWDNIAKKTKKRRLAFWWWSSALLLLLVISTGGYFFMISGEDKAVARLEKNKEDPVNKEASEQAGKEAKEQPFDYAQDGKTQVPLPEENADAKNAVINNITDVDGNNKKQSNLFEGKTKATITVSANSPEENKNTVALNNKQIRTTKGKLKTQQTNPSIDESIAANKSIKSNINKPVVADETKEEISGEENKQAVVATPIDKKIATAEEEKKTNPEKQGQAKKENITTAKGKIKKHWFFEAAAIPVIASSQYSENISFNRTLALNNSISVYNAKLANASIEPAVAFSLLVHRQISNKIEVGTGLQYMLLKENMSLEGKETKTAYAFVDRLVNGRLVADTIATVTEGARTINAVNSYQLFSIPVFVQYSIIQKKQWSVGAVGGFYFNISGNYKNEINRNAAAPLRTAPGTTNKSNTGMDIFAGIRISKKLSKRFDLFAMPSMRWSLAKYNVKNSLLDKNINQAGVGFGMCYKIK